MTKGDCNWGVGYTRGEHRHVACNHLSRYYLQIVLSLRAASTPHCLLMIPARDHLFVTDELNRRWTFYSTVSCWLSGFYLLHCDTRCNIFWPLLARPRSTMTVVWLWNIDTEQSQLWSTLSVTNGAEYYMKKHFDTLFEKYSCKHIYIFFFKAWMVQNLLVAIVLGTPFICLARHAHICSNHHVSTSEVDFNGSQPPWTRKSPPWSHLNSSPVGSQGSIALSHVVDIHIGPSYCWGW